MDPKRIGKKIKLARVEMDLTQSQLADKIHAKQKSISRYETGITVPSVETLLKIAKVLDKAPVLLSEQQYLRSAP